MFANPKVGRAMTAQVNRVNEFAMLDDLQQQLTDALTENTRLRGLLAKYEGFDTDTLNRGYVETPQGKFYNGRPVIALIDAPMFTGLNYIQCYRRLKAVNGWQGVQRDNGHWLIYTDQPLTAASRRRKTGR